MDFSKLSTGAKLALVGGAVLVINLFLPWYKVDYVIGTASVKAFDADFFAWGGSLVAIAGAVVLLLKAIGTATVNAGQFKTEQLALILGGVGFVLIVLQWITESGNELIGLNVSFGLFIGIIASAAVAYGAYMAMKDAGLDMPGMGG